MLLAPGAAAMAVEFVSVQVERDGSAYELHIEAVLAAPPERMLSVLTDYDRIHELHPRMIESRALGEVAPATQEVYTRFEGCVIFFCKTLHRVERIRADTGGLFAEDVPGRGSFSEGQTEWRFSAEGAGARLHYEARFTPAFMVAPLIGPGILARSVERMTIETMVEAERRAMQDDD